MFTLMVPGEDRKSGKQDMEKEIERLIDKYGNDVLRVSFIYLKDKQRAEDAFQEVFLKIYKKYGGFSHRSSERTWIIRITINVCRDILRSTWIKRVFPVENVGEEKTSVDIDEKLARKDENRILMDEIMNLSTVYKEIIVLYYYQGFDTVELSRILKIPESTVRTRLFRAREILRRKIDGRIEYYD